MSAQMVTVGLRWILGVGIAGALLPVGRPDDAADAGDVARSLIRIEDRNSRIALVDVDGDGDLDLVTVETGGIFVRKMDAAGVYSADVDLSIDWPSPHTAWSLVDADGNGTVELALFVDGEEIRTLDLGGAGEDDAKGKLELTATGVFPRGHHRMNFFRDIDGDGLIDLVLPGAGVYSLYLRQADGSFVEPISVSFETETDYEMGRPDRLGESFGQDVTVPWFSLRDIDGDNDMDLVSETSDEVAVYLAQPGFAGDPTWRLDLAALRDELPPDEGLDFGDLLSQATRQTDWLVDDLDGKAPKDLVIQVAGKIRVYLGGAATGMTATPDQILKASGNVLWFFLHSAEEGELPDLNILRGEKISLGRVIRWIVLPGELDFDLFTYSNQSRTPGAETFSRRPTRRVTLELEIPRLLKLMDEIEEAGEQDDQEAAPAIRVALDGDGVADDILDLRDGELVVFRGAAPTHQGVIELARSRGLGEAFQAYLARDIDTLEDGGTRTYDLSDIKKIDKATGSALRAATEGRTPDVRISVVAPGVPSSEAAELVQSGAGSIHARDLNGDGLDDWLVIGAGENAKWVVQFLVRRP